MGKDRRVTTGSHVIVDLDEARKTVEILLNIKPAKYHKSNEVFWRLEYLKVNLICVGTTDLKFEFCTSLM